MRTQFKKEFALRCITTLNEYIPFDSIEGEDDKMDIAESSRYLDQLIEEVFEFDFFELRSNIELIMKKLGIKPIKPKTPSSS